MFRRQISVPLAYLKHHLNDFVQVDFSEVEEAENEFARIFDT
jgi:hypothetical protein